jgi:hypothetical protein
MIKNLIALTLTMVVVTTSIQARPFNKTTKTTNSSRPIANAVSHSLSSAQAVANHMSKIGRIGHFGGNPYSREGVGMGGTAQQAIRNCCFYGQYSIKDQGVAQGSNGMWYACNRY